MLHQVASSSGKGLERCTILNIMKRPPRSAARVYLPLKSAIETATSLHVGWRRHGLDWNSVKTKRARYEITLR